MEHLAGTTLSGFVRLSAPPDQRRAVAEHLLPPSGGCAECAAALVHEFLASADDVPERRAVLIVRAAPAISPGDRAFSGVIGDAPAASEEDLARWEEWVGTRDIRPAPADAEALLSLSFARKGGHHRRRFRGGGPIFRKGARLHRTGCFRLR